MSNIGDRGPVDKALNFIQKKVSPKMKDFKADLKCRPKEDVKVKLDTKNMESAAKKLGNGIMNKTIFVPKGVGKALVGLSMITPKKISEKLVGPGMELSTSGSSKGTKVVRDDYAISKRKMKGLEAQKMKGKVMKNLGSGMEKIANHLMKKGKADSKWVKPGLKLERAGYEMKRDGEVLKELADENKLDLKADRPAFESRSGLTKKHDAFRKAAENKVDNLILNNKLDKKLETTLKDKIQTYINDFERENPRKGITKTPQGLVAELRRAQVKPLPKRPQTEDIPPPPTRPGPPIFTD